MTSPPASKSTPTRSWPGTAADAILAAALLLAAAAAWANETDPRAAFAVVNGSAAGDRDAALALLEQHAAGDAQAAALLGLVHYHGLATARDRDRALTLWRDAAARGNTEAAYNAGLELLRRGQEPGTAIALLEQAAASGDLLACFAAGTALADEAQSDDLNRAAEWLRRAAAGGYAPAQHNLATVLLRRDAPGDNDEARRWLTQAATTFTPAAERLAGLRANPTVATTMPAVDAAALSQSEIPHIDRDNGTHARDWVLAQSPEHYTLQVAAARSAPALERLLERLRDDQPAAIFMHRPNAREPWTAVMGLFDSYAAAQVALSRLPAALAANSPWIRRFEVLQGELVGEGRKSP